MDLLSIFYYLTLLIVSTGIVGLGFYLLKKYQYGFLSYYLYYLLTFTFSGLIKILSCSIAPSLFSNSEKISLETTNILMSFISFPLVIIIIYFFLQFLDGLLKKSLSKTFYRVFFLFWGLMFLCFIVISKLKIENKYSSFYDLFYVLSNAIALLIIYSALLRVFIYINDFFKTKNKSRIRFFIILYLFSYSFSLIFISPIITSRVGYYHIPLLFLLINFLPIIYLKYLLKHIHFSPNPNIYDFKELKVFFQQEKISPREQEVIELVLLGKTNKEIEAILFISFNTVRNHIYSIFKKLEVNSRSQLINHIHDIKKFKI